MSVDELGATVSTWLELVRRARLGPTVKSVAFYLAGKANNDGTRIYPGVSRAAIECELSRSSVRRALKTLRDAGLIEPVRRGNRRRRRADEYRLIIGPNVLERVKVPTPDEHDAAINALAEREREQQQRRRARWLARRQSNQRSPRGALKDGSTLTRDVDQRSPLRAPTSPIDLAVGATSPLPQPLAVEPVQDRYARARETSESVKTSDEYAAARDYLTRLPDFGAAWVERARAELGDDAPLRAVIVRAAERARTEAA